MKQYRVSLDVIASPSMPRSELAGRLGVSRCALTSRRVMEGILWSYEPTTGRAGELDDRVAQPRIRSPPKPGA